MRSLIESAHVYSATTICFALRMAWVLLAAPRIMLLLVLFWNDLLLILGSWLMSPLESCG